MLSQELLSEIEDIFGWWLESGVEFGMPQYSVENCDKAKSIVLNLVAELDKIGLAASDNEKLEAFKSSVLAMNNLDDLVPGLIETGEREQLCELYDAIGKAAGLMPDQYGSGDGIASEWRTW